MTETVPTTKVAGNHPTVDPPIPYGGDRLALPGEKCMCGFPAVVVYVTLGYGDIPFCGSHG